MVSDTFSPTATAFAIVSPCSQCKNQLSEQGADGKPSCPRRRAQADLKLTQIDPDSHADPRLEILAAFGTEGTDNEGDNSLRNPVYLDSTKTTLVWIAALRDNSGVFDKDGNQIAPPITDLAFIPNSTEWINCQSMPFVPAMSEAQYRQTGAYKEGDVVAATVIQRQQKYNTPSVNVDNELQYSVVPIQGMVTKLNLVFSTPRAEVEDDYNVQGA